MNNFVLPKGEILNLTKKQKRIYDFISAYIKNKGYSPSIDEIRKHAGLSAVSTVHRHLLNLEQRGWIRRIPNTSRSIILVSPENNSVNSLPLLGTIAAGNPIESLQISDEMLSVPEDFSRVKNTYVLKVKGDSMIEECIMDGDFVIVEQRSEPAEGEMVVALLDNEEATLKKFYRENASTVRLQPANSSMEPIYVSDRDLKIQGIVIGVIRKY